MKKAVLMFVFMALVFRAVPVLATPLSYGGYPAKLNDGVRFVGLASLTLGGESVFGWCVDPLHLISATSWEVTVVGLSSPALLSGLLPGVGIDDYKAMFLLGRQFTGTNQDTDVSLQHIIWSFADPTSYPLSAGQQTQKSNTLASVNSYNWDNASVLVPIGEKEAWKGQMFEIGSVSGIPEPAALALMGSGLLALGLFKRWHPARNRK